MIHVRKTSQLWTTIFAEYLENYFISWILNELELDQEAAWPRGQCSRLAFRRSRYRVSLWPLFEFVLSWSKFKPSATLAKTAPCQLGFLILLCYILLVSNHREISDLGLNILTSQTDKVNKLLILIYGLFIMDLSLRSIKTNNWSADNFKRTHQLNELYTWACNTVMWHWSVNTLFDRSQLNITWVSIRMSTIKLKTHCIFLGHNN